MPDENPLRGSIPGDFGNIYVAALALPGGRWLVDVIRSDSSAGGYVTAVNVGDPSAMVTVFAPMENSLERWMATGLSSARVPGRRR